MPAFGKSTLTDSQRNTRELAATSIASKRARGDIEGANRLSKSLQGSVGSENRGRPPSVLLLSAYAIDGGEGAVLQHISRVPVVITNISFPYPSDVDYIPTLSGVPMPAIMTIDMTLAETHSAREYENFSFGSFKTGQLPGF